jgi:predicted DNA-binding transcriptional regulator AlpA
MGALTDPSFEGKSDLRLFYRFADLKRLGIISNWQTLSRWVAAGDFPPGVYLGPNVRAWPVSEIEAWIESRPAGNGGVHGG